jgi:sec-independent protein translocase protein TatA
MDVLELGIIAAIVIVFVVMGPKKIPELARALGSAKKEFSQGAQEPAAGLTASAGSVQGGQDELMVAARNLGITTEGKTREQISAEIVHKTAGT